MHVEEGLWHEVKYCGSVRGGSVALAGSEAAAVCVARTTKVCDNRRNLRQSLLSSLLYYGGSGWVG